MSDDQIWIEGDDGAHEAPVRQPEQLKRRLKVLGVICVLVVCAGLVMPSYLFVGSRAGAAMSVPEFFAELGRNLAGYVGFFTGLSDDGVREAVFCGTVLAAMMGAALGMCGSVYQGALRNPLAAPKTLGVMSGGALGALVFYMTPVGSIGPSFFSESAFSYNVGSLMEWYDQLDPLSQLWLTYGKALCSVAGCFLIVAAVILIASFVGRGRLSNVTMIIAGQIFAVAITGLITFVRSSYVATGDYEMADLLMQIENYALGYTYLLPDLALVGVPLLVCMAAVYLMRNKLTMLSFGDEEAQSMGVNVNRWRYAMVAVCTFMVGWAISFMGHVAFLGFISAHVARRIVGPDMRYLLPASALVGAIFITFFYLLTNTGLPFAPQGSVGMYTSVVGAAVFLVLALRQRGRATSDWQ